VALQFLQATAWFFALGAKFRGRFTGRLRDGECLRKCVQDTCYYLVGDTSKRTTSLAGDPGLTSG
jgi:hypothetical protein